MNEHGSASNTASVERKTIEKNRRILMKNLCLQLVSIIPDQQTVVSTLVDQLDLAIGHIKELKERIECMKDTLRIRHGNKENIDDIESCNVSVSIEERDPSSASELIFIRGLSSKLQTCDVINVLNEEGLAILNVCFSSTKDYTIFLTIHTQVISSRIGVDLGRLHDRLNRLLN